MRNLFSVLRSDPRHYQIGVLSTLLLYGTVWLDLEVRLEMALVVVTTALLSQFLLGCRIGIPFDPRSALISALSLCLLLRTDAAIWAAVTAAVTIASKFFLRVDGRHVFNPTNFGLVAVMAATGRIWVSPGQWGSLAFFALLLACVGGLVVRRATRSDVTWAFLLFYGGLVLGRSWWLGHPLALPLHHLQNGALLIFTFFMISDPKTTPASRTGRLLFALLVAVGASFVQFGLYRPNGLLWSLACLAPSVPLIDRLLPGRRYRWPLPNRSSFPEGDPHENRLSVPPGPAPQPAR